MYNYFLYTILTISSLYIGPSLTMLLNSIYNFLNNHTKENIMNILFFISLQLFGLWDTLIYSLIVKLCGILSNYNLILEKFNKLKSEYFGPENLNKINSIKNILDNYQHYIDDFNAVIDKLILYGCEYVDNSDMKPYKDNLIKYYNLFIPQNENIIKINPIDQPQLSEQQNVEQFIQLLQQPNPVNLEEINKLMSSLEGLQKISKNLDNIDLKPNNLTRAQRRYLKKHNKH